MHAVNLDLKVYFLARPINVEGNTWQSTKLLIFYSCIVVLKIAKWLLELLVPLYLSKLGNLNLGERVSAKISLDKDEASLNSKSSSSSF